MRSWECSFGVEDKHHVWLAHNNNEWMFLTLEWYVICVSCLFNANGIVIWNIGFCWSMTYCFVSTRNCFKCVNRWVASSVIIRQYLIRIETKMTSHHRRNNAWVSQCLLFTSSLSLVKSLTVTQQRSTLHIAASCRQPMTLPNAIFRVHLRWVEKIQCVIS